MNLIPAAITSIALLISGADSSPLSALFKTVDKDNEVNGDYYDKCVHYEPDNEKLSDEAMYEYNLQLDNFVEEGHMYFYNESPFTVEYFKQIPWYVDASYYLVTVSAYGGECFPDIFGHETYKELVEILGYPMVVNQQCTAEDLEHDISHYFAELRKLGYICELKDLYVGEAQHHGEDNEDAVTKRTSLVAED